MFNEAFAGTLPIQGTDIAAKWDTLYYFLVGISVFFFVLVVGAMIYFLIKYRHQTGRKPEYITGSHLLEAIWVAVPTVLLLVIFGWGYVVYHDMKTVPSDAYEIKVIGKQWLWTFLYDNGTASVGELYVPINRPVKLVMTSEDVLHGFFIPNFRIKQDVVPGMYTSIWFEATVPGRHQVFCTEYCGTSHSGMLAHVNVLTDQQWKDWLRGKKITGITTAGATAEEAAQEEKAELQPMSLVEQGRKIYETKSCNTCHSTDGTNKIGPTWKGLYGSEVELVDGKKVTEDDTFIHTCITDPNSVRVKGYGPVMPTFKGVLTEQDIAAVIAFMKSIK
jgi:cytochrome c oxidase subunit 2